MSLVFERYQEQQVVIWEGDVFCGIVTNSVELYRIIVQVKEQKLEGYFAQIIGDDKKYPILSGGRIKHFPYDEEYDRLMKALMGF